MDTGTKLVNLADEVVQARKHSGGAFVDKEEEARLRAAVERTLRVHDPVFVLLQKWLMSAISERLVGRADSAEVEESNRSGKDGVARAPGHLRAGREVAIGRPRLVGDQEGSASAGGVDSRDAAGGLVVKGFEDAVLVGAVGEALGRIIRCVDWMDSVWENECGV